MPLEFKISSLLWISTLLVLIPAPVLAEDYFNQDELKYEPEISSEHYIEKGQSTGEEGSLSLPAELSAQKRTQWNFMIDVGIGHSTNIARFEGSPEADFLQVSQSLNLASDLNDSFQIYLKQFAYIRKYKLPEVDEVFKNNYINGEVGINARLYQNWDLALALDGDNYVGREVDFRNNQTTGLDYRSYTMGGNAFLRRYGETSFTEVKLRREALRALTEIYDEMGNQYKNDHDAVEVGIKYGDSLYKELNWELSYYFQFRQYLERRARLVDGGIAPNFDNDFLIENYHKFAVAMYFNQLKVQAGLNYVEDRIDGAETRKVPYLEASLPFNISQYLYVVPSARWESSFYSNFIGNIINDPNAKDLRIDNIWSAGVEMSLTLGKIQPTLALRRNVTDTNYKIFKYEENLVLGSLRAFF